MTKERSVLASFHSEDEAKQAESQIKDMGVEVTQVAHFSAFGSQDTDISPYTLAGEIPSLAALTLNEQPSSRDAGILLSIDPSASGMSDGEGRVTGRDWLLTVVCPEDKVEAVVQTIKDCNGFT